MSYKKATLPLGWRRCAGTYRTSDSAHRMAKIWTTRDSSNFYKIFPFHQSFIIGRRPMTEDEELLILQAERDALFRNPTPEAALVWWHKSGNPPPLHDTVPLATVHKARLQWLEATDTMLAESIEWLTSHKYETAFKGAPPLTPERRDADRALIGKLPLKYQSSLRSD